MEGKVRDSPVVSENLRRDLKPLMKALGSFGVVATFFGLLMNRMGHSSLYAIGRFCALPLLIAALAIAVRERALRAAALPVLLIILIVISFFRS